MPKDNEKRIRKLLNYSEDENLSVFETLEDINDNLEEVVPIFSDLDLNSLKQIKGEKGDKGDQGEQGESIEGPMGPQGPKGEKGDKGFNGLDGYTPIKGVDYFDGERGPKGDTGADGKDGKDGSPDSAEDVRDKLQTLKGEDRLDKSAIKGIEDIEYQLNTRYGNVTSRVRTDSTLSGSGTDSDPLRVVGGGGLGDVAGPASSTDNAIVTFDGTTGKLVQDSGFTLDDFQKKTFVTVGSSDADYITDGVADNVQIQQAIDTVSATGGGVVFIKKGEYSIGGTPIVPASNVSIIGESFGSVVLKKASGSTGGNANIIRVVKGVAQTYLDTVTIENLVFDGTDQGASGNLVHLQGVNNLTLRNLELIQPNAFGIVVGSDGGALPYIEGLTVENIIYTASDSTNDNDGIGGGGIKKSVFRNINIYKSNRRGTGIDLTNMLGVNFSDIYIEFATPHATNWGLASDFGAKNVKCQRVYVKNAGQYGFYFGSTSDGTVEDLKIDNCTSDTAQVNGVYCPGISGSEGSDLSITNSTIKGWANGTAGQGVKVEYFSGVKVIGNSFRDPLTAGQNPARFIDCVDVKANNNYITGVSTAIIQSSTTNYDFSNNTYTSYPVTPGDALTIKDGMVGIGKTPLVALDVIGAGAFTGDVTVLDEAYGSGWNGSLEVPTKNAIYDKIQTVGDVLGPVSSTDNAITRYDGVTGKLLQNSNATISDLGKLALTGSSTEEALTVTYSGSNNGALIINNGTNKAVYIDNNVNSDGLRIDTDVTNSNHSENSLELTHTTVVNDGTTKTKTGAAVIITSDVTETSGTVTDSAQVLDINQTHADATGDVVNIDNDGTGNGLMIQQDGVLGSGKRALYVLASNALTSSRPLVNFQHSNSASTDGVQLNTQSGSGYNLQLLQGGTGGNSLFIDDNNTGSGSGAASINLDKDGNNAAAISGLWVNVANAGAGAAYAAIFEAGSVGVGLTAPTSLLHVSGPIATAISTKTSAYTITATDSTILTDATTAGFTVTLPTPVGISGRHYTIKKIDSTGNIVSVATAAGVIDGSVTQSLDAQWESVTVQSNGTNWYII